MYDTKIYLLKYMNPTGDTVSWPEVATVQNGSWFGLRGVRCVGLALRLCYSFMFEQLVFPSMSERGEHFTSFVEGGSLGLQVM